eukprot:TRINITY_DN18621_c0_g1_i1.p1 TRINITY_DN18621_c0_g1~~TRINITY_DN18621_c0_g1_i1.p1  ORF type:complete len:280 (-),score=67.99 TRINITY_DN18621_c0_g1_i1:205-1044(-)
MASLAEDARAMHVGSYSAWLTKLKGSSAKAKWLCNSTKRYFTIDFDSYLLSYAHDDGGKKVAQTIAFADIEAAELLPMTPELAAALEERSSFGFILRTPERAYELFAGSYSDARLWVDGLNAGRDMASVRSELGRPRTAEPPTLEVAFRTPRRESPAGSSATATPDTAACSSEAGASWLDSQSPSMATTSVPSAEVISNSSDPFAALDALEELAGPPPALPESPLRDRAISSELLREARLLVTEGRKPSLTSQEVRNAAAAAAALAGAAPVPPSPPPPG